MAEISPKALLRPSKEAQSKIVKEEAVVVHFVSGNYFVLDTVSTFLWNQIKARPTSYEALVEAVLEEYEVEREAILPDIKNFCSYMLAEKLIEIQVD